MASVELVIRHIWGTVVEAPVATDSLEENKDRTGGFGVLSRTYH